MAITSITFRNIEINNSLQEGDTAYYCSYELFNGGDLHVQNSDLRKIGLVKSINKGPVINKLQCITGNNTAPQRNDFIFFSKDNAVNMSSPIGYYARAKFINNSTNKKSEMFAASCEVFESSK
tara:strand:+ start:261 stop:629 length:369 start_codon:yes stop_codon:yes gene_type:complete